MQEPQPFEVECTETVPVVVPPVAPPVEPPVVPPDELPPWQTAQGVLVEFTFACADTPPGALPVVQEPQLFDVDFTLTVPVVGGVVGGVTTGGGVVVGGVTTGGGVVGAVWQVVQAILAALIAV
jgi:hypothetical protein